MINSYKHIRVPFNYIHDNIWSSYTQYYRTLLCAQSIHIASILPYTNAYSNNSHKISFRSRYLANIIGKFLYSLIGFIKTYRHFNILYKQILLSKYFKKSISKHIYRKKEYLFTLKLKNILLLIKSRCIKKIKKKKHLLWKRFYSIPNNFWNLSKQKKIKSVIWSFINIVSYNNISLKKKIKKKKHYYL